MKSKEEPNALRREAETVSNALHALAPEELEQVTGGIDCLTTLKEKAISAATDTASAADRRAVQSEIERLIKQLD